MITATVTKDTNGIYRGFNIKGHALFEDAGKDIVCSAVSILTINTVNSIEKFTDCDFDCDSSTGIKFVFKGVPNEKAILLMDSMVLGLKGISSNYSDYLRLEIKEV